jgi:hypothetical protein
MDLPPKNRRFFGKCLIVISEAWEGQGEISDIVSKELPGLEETVSKEGSEQIHRYLGLTAK